MSRMYRDTCISNICIDVNIVHRYRFTQKLSIVLPISYYLYDWYKNKKKLKTKFEPSIIKNDVIFGQKLIFSITRL